MLLSLRLRSTLALVRCCPTVASVRTYATQAQAHLAPTKPSTFGQPTSKSHTHLGK